MYQSSFVHCPPGHVNAIGIDLDSAVAVPIVAVGIDSGPIIAAPMPSNDKEAVSVVYFPWLRGTLSRAR